MENLNYCVDCRRIASFNEGCSFCQSQNIKALVRNAPVNVIGTKLKGRVMNVKNDMVHILYVDEGKQKVIKPFESVKLQKIL
ncbi:MAG: hypothetical protein ACOYVK_11710 [Bacillota bacterium]